MMKETMEWKNQVVMIVQIKRMNINLMKMEKYLIN